MTPIQRIHRVMRWLDACGQMMPTAEVVHPRRFLVPVYEQRCDAANDLFAVEIEFVATLAAVSVAKVSDRELPNEYAAAQQRLLNERYG